ncbi:GTPase-associated system all-helical protein GASH [Pelosinus propionicus]|uniref:GTPase-associated system helical domain-containing protein n=1 Tax=Pelosinus propionicus DSM 13327 TaxID=1123291 RepID=A0A1I4P876_9FIRM|nr:GTPase-associated system all-helical protein GASH [Pelosinus propionicus]SFM24001.1 hypothetical protein SAMN04490355_105923 [Pelosinus propionicus DSM 13327]
MNKNFAEWYRKIDIEPNNAQLECRWKGIKEFISDCQPNDIFELVKLFYNLSTAKKFCEDFADFFTKTDSAFQRNRQNELVVLAGVTLMEIIDQESDLADLAMLATISMNFQNRRGAIADIYQQILQKFSENTASLREDIPDTSIGSSNIPSGKSLLLSISSQNVAWDENIRKSLSDYVTSLNKFIVQFVQKHNENLNHINIYTEDSRILWWMVGGWSNDFNLPFKDFSIADASIIAGKELADNINNLPGPYSSRPVLCKVLNSCKKTKDPQQNDFVNLIDKLDKEWKKQTIEEYPCGSTREITPILTALSKSIEVDEVRGWISSYNKATSLEADKIKISPEELAYQTYLECLTIKCLKYIEG